MSHLHRSRQDHGLAADLPSVLTPYGLGGGGGNLARPQHEASEPEERRRRPTSATAGKYYDGTPTSSIDRRQVLTRPTESSYLFSLESYAVKSVRNPFEALQGSAITTLTTRPEISTDTPF